MHHFHHGQIELESVVRKRFAISEILLRILVVIVHFSGEREPAVDAIDIESSVSPYAVLFR